MLLFLILKYRNNNNNNIIKLLSHHPIRLSHIERLLCTCSFTVGKKETTIQNGYRKWGTHARVFCQTLEHGNSKNEMKQTKKVRREAWKKSSGHRRKKKFQRHKPQLGPTVLPGSLRPRQLMNYLTNPTYT